MPAGHLISRVTILGTGLIGGSFALALRKYASDMHITGWDRADVVREAQSRGALDEAFSAELAPALQNTDLIYIALPIAATLDLLPEIARHAPFHALVTDACSTKVRIVESAAKLYPAANGPLFLGAQQHDYAVGLASHLPQLAAVALAGYLYDHLDENGLPITLAGPGLRDSLRLAGSPYSTWRDIVLTNQEVLSAALDLFARRLDDLREKLASRELETDFDAANELYKLLRSL